MSTQRVAVVADSTLSIPGDLADEAGIRVVPVHVVIDGSSLREGLDITPDQVADELRNGASVTTSRPSPQEFVSVYRAAAEAGATGVVSVHLSAELSGTAQAAKIAARSAGIPVEVVDSRTITMAGGFAALDAAAAAADGASVEEAAEVARRTAAASSLFFYVHTLEYLQRGGRIGTAQRYLGTALRVRPLLGMEDGRVAALEKVRTSNKALLRLAELATEAAAGLDQPRLAVHHLQAEASANTVLEALLAAMPGAPHVESEVGAVIAAHTGPGVVAVAVVPGKPS